MTKLQLGKINRLNITLSKPTSCQKITNQRVIRVKKNLTFVMASFS